MSDVVVPVRVDARLAGFAQEMEPVREFLEELAGMGELSSNALGQAVNRLQALIGAAGEANGPRGDLLEIYRTLRELNQEHTQSALNMTETQERLQGILAQLSEVRREQELLEIGRFNLTDQRQRSNAIELGRNTDIFEGRPEAQTALSNISNLFLEGEFGQAMVQLDRTRRLLLEQGEELSEQETDRLRVIQSIYEDMTRTAEDLTSANRAWAEEAARGKMSMEDMVVAAVEGRMSVGQLLEGGVANVGASMEDRAIGMLPPGAAAATRGVLEAARKPGTAGRLATAGRLVSRAAIPVGAAMMGYNAWQEGIFGIGGAQAAQEYRGLTGDMDTGWGTAAQYDIQARTMAISPFLNREQSQQIMRTAMQEGYRGEQFEEAVDFAAENFKRFNMDFAESMDIYRVNIRMAGESTEETATTLENLSQVAADTNVSVDVLRQNFASASEAFAAMGAGTMTNELSTELTGMFAGNEMLADIDPTGLLNSTLVQQHVSDRLGTNINMLPATIARMVESGQGEALRGIITGAGGAAQAALANIGFVPGMDIQSIRDMGAAHLATAMQILNLPIQGSEPQAQAIYEILNPERAQQVNEEAVAAVEAREVESNRRDISTTPTMEDPGNVRAGSRTEPNRSGVKAPSTPQPGGRAGQRGYSVTGPKTSKESDDPLMNDWSEAERAAAAAAFSGTTFMDRRETRSVVEVRPAPELRRIFEFMDDLNSPSGIHNRDVRQRSHTGATNSNEVYPH